jgi:hypothetical protein
VLCSEVPFALCLFYMKVEEMIDSVDFGNPRQRFGSSMLYLSAVFPIISNEQERAACSVVGFAVDDRVVRLILVRLSVSIVN